MVNDHLSQALARPSEKDRSLRFATHPALARVPARGLQPLVFSPRWATSELSLTMIKKRLLLWFLSGPQTDRITGRRSLMSCGSRAPRLPTGVPNAPATAAARDRRGDGPDVVF